MTIILTQVIYCIIHHLDVLLKKAPANRFTALLFEVFGATRESDQPAVRVLLVSSPDLTKEHWFPQRLACQCLYWYFSFRSALL
jgi:hypothetical protein